MSNKKNLPAKSSGEQATSLQNVGTGTNNLIDAAVANLSPEELAEVRSNAIAEKIRLEVDAQERGVDYQFGRKVAEDHVDTFNMLEKGGKFTSQKVVSEIKTGAGNMRLESKSGPACFVATAAYGDSSHKDVAFLRQFRNNILKNYFIGRIFIAMYWRVGPFLAKPVKANKKMQIIARGFISFVVRILRRHKAL